MYTYELTMSSGRIHTTRGVASLDRMEYIISKLDFIAVSGTIKCRCSLIESIEQFLTSEYQPTSTKLDL